MIEVIVFIYLMGMIWDDRIIKKRERPLHKRVFNVPARIVWPLFTIFLSVALFSRQRWDHMLFLMILTVIPLYLYKRDAYLRVSERAGRFMDGDHPKFALTADAFGVVLHWGFCILAFGVLFNKAGDHFELLASGMVDLIATAIFSSAVLFFLVYHAAKRFSAQPFRINVALTTNGQPGWKLFAVPVSAGFVFAVISTLILLYRKVQPTTPLSESLMDADSSLILFVFMVMALIVAPLFEEIVFRGYFYRVVEAVKGRAFAVISIALVFAFLHIGQYWGDAMAIAMVTLMGFALTLLRAWTGSTIASAVAHYVYNVGVTLIPGIVLVLSNPAYFEYHANAHSYDALKKIELLEESVQDRPDFLPAYNDLAWLYAQEGVHLERAMELIEEALRHDPRNLMYLDTKAEVLTELGRFREALELRRALIKRRRAGPFHRQQLKELRELEGLIKEDQPLSVFSSF